MSWSAMALEAAEVGLDLWVEGFLGLVSMPEKRSSRLSSLATALVFFEAMVEELAEEDDDGGWLVLAASAVEVTDALLVR